MIARSAPDGYNLLVSANSMVDIPAIYGNAPYDWKTAFQPISHIQAVPAVIVVTPVLADQDASPSSSRSASTSRAA